MSFLVIIAFLLAFMILIIIEKMLIERIRSQKVDIISDRNQLLKLIIGLSGYWLNLLLMHTNVNNCSWFSNL